MIVARHVSRAIVVLAICSPAVALAQRGQDAAVVGTIRDSSAGLIVDAKVTVASQQLIGGPRTSFSGPDGMYQFPFLPPGVYDIAVERAGFRTVKRASVALVPGLTSTVDFRLEVADIAETVIVEQPAVAIDVHSSAAINLIDRTLLENLPLTRNVNEWINLAPGITRDVAFGGTVRSNPLFLDGTNLNEPGWGTATVTPNLHWIDELQIIAVGADAQYGEFTGALAKAITRSGSNRLSGFADFWTTRPNWTDSNRGSLPPQLKERFRPIEIIERWDADLQAAGPVIRDRLWFFAGGERYRNVSRPASFGGVPRTEDEPRFDSNEGKFLSKLSGAASSTLRVEAYYGRNVARATGANAGPLVRPEAINRSNRDETMWNGRLLWTVSSRLFAEVRHGGHSVTSDTGPREEQRSGPPGHYDQLTGVVSRNFRYIREFFSQPTATAVQVTYVGLQHGRQRHEINTGFEHERARLRAFDGYVGGRAFYDFDGQPDWVDLFEGATFRPTQGRHTFYVQDAWRAADRLTVNLGVRAGFYRGSVPGDEAAFRARSVSPRAGAAWDATGDHATVVRVHYGRYHDQMVTSFYDFLDPLSHPTGMTATVVGPNEFTDFVPYSTGAGATIDPEISFPFAEELVLGADRQLPLAVFARVQYISRQFRNAIAFVDPARVWLPVQKIDPGVDGLVGTADDGGPLTVFYDQDPTRSALVLTNPKDAYRHYHGFQLIVGRRSLNAAEFQASYTWSRTIGNYNNAFSSNAANGDLGMGGVFVNPNGRVNTEGRTPQDFAHEIKALGTYRVPLWGGAQVSGVYRYQSGRPWARSASGFGPQTDWGNIYMEPRATRRLRSINTLDLRVEKMWKPTRKYASVTAFVDVFNLANQGVSLLNREASGPNFGLPVQWLEPRTMRAGAKLLF